VSVHAPLPHLGLVLGARLTLTAEQGSYSLSGQDASLERGYPLTAAQGSYTLAGQDAALRTGLTLTAEQGTYGVSGQDAGLKSALLLTAAQGAYTLTGYGVASPSTSTPAPLPHLGLLDGLGGVLKLVAEQGSYTISGQDATLRTAYRLRPDIGDYNLAGMSSSLTPSFGRSGDPAPLPHLGLLLGAVTAGRTLIADPGIYVLTGSDALIDWEHDAEQGSYTLTGQDASLRLGHRLDAEFGTYTLAGQDAGSSRTGAALTMAADYTTYSIAGQDANLLHGRKASAEHGFYALMGQIAALAYNPPAAIVMPAEFGSYLIDGFEVVFNNHRLFGETGVYALDGYDVAQPPVPAEPGGGGGYLYMNPPSRAARARTAREQRRALGILPEEARQKITTAVRKEAKKDEPRLQNLAPVAVEVAQEHGVSAKQVVEAIQQAYVYWDSRQRADKQQRMTSDDDEVSRSLSQDEEARKQMVEALRVLQAQLVAMLN
jgi:hypothetical protein